VDQHRISTYCPVRNIRWIFPVPFPGTFIPGIDFSKPEINYLTQMWAARQIAIAGIIGFSLIRKSPVMLSVSLLAYCIMNLQDLIIGISRADYGLAGGASFFFILPALMIFVLARKQRTASAQP
jgi:hypothetical protein